jgi:hypothetical protein
MRLSTTFSPQQLLSGTTFESLMTKSTDELREKIYNMIIKLDHIDFVYVVKDAAQLQAQQATIEVGNPETVGDVIATQDFPFYKSVAIVCDEGTLKKSQLMEYLEKHNDTPVEHLAIVVRGPPTDEAIELAELKGVAIFDPVDITNKLIQFSATDILTEYTDSFEESVSSRAGSVSESSTMEEFGTVPVSNSSNKVTATIIAVVYNADISPISHSFESDSEIPRRTVVLWEVRNNRSEKVEYGNRNITYIFDDGLQSKVSQFSFNREKTDGPWDMGPQPGSAPDIEPKSKVRWISFVEHRDGRKLDAAILRMRYDFHDDIRLAISEATETSKDYLPFDS